MAENTPSKPRISIVTPSLNQGDYLKATLDSVLNQGYENLEYIVMDGGSSDNSVDILKNYSSRLDYWASEPDAGQPQAINRGLRRASGEILAYINSDDTYLPGALACAAECLGCPSPDSPMWVSGNATHTYPDGRQLLWRPSPPPEPWLAVTYPWGVPQVACFWRRELFEECGFFREDLQYTFDTEFQVRLLLSGYVPEFVDQTLGNRLIHDACKTATSHRKFRDEQQKFLDIFSSRLPAGQMAKAKFMHDWKDMHYARHDGRYGHMIARLGHLALTHPAAFLRQTIATLEGKYADD